MNNPKLPPFVLSFFLVIFFIVSCQKEAIKSISNENLPGNRNNPEESKVCGMTMYDYHDMVHDVQAIDRVSFKDGLVDELAAFYGYTYKMVYDINKKLALSKVFIGGELAYTIDFSYENNKVIRETWFVGNTQVVDDIVNLYYNNRGQQVKNESINYDYYYLYEYTASGDLSSWTQYIGGKIAFRGEYTYNQHYINPFLSLKGLSYNFTYGNSAFARGRWWYSSEKVIIYDENGNPEIFYEQDPGLTVWQLIKGNTPLQINYTDKVTGKTILNTFEYANCSYGDHLFPSAPEQSKGKYKGIRGLAKKVVMGGMNLETVFKKEEK